MSDPFFESDPYAKPAFDDPALRFTQASRKLRFGGYLLDGALALLTLGFGWLIWSLIVWNRGQTPAKQILRMRVWALESQSVATWGHMAIRQFLIPAAFVIPGNLLLGLETATAGAAILLVYALPLADSLWIFKDDRNRRITDIWAKTAVLIERR